MSVSILLITHEEIGHALMQAAKHTFGKLPLPITPLPISSQQEFTRNLELIKRAVHESNLGKGVLILTDIIGATPCNLATHLKTTHRIKIISGLNLPMLIKVLNYSQLNLDQLAEKALCGGKEGVIHCEQLALAE